ncbi:putative meiosis protein mei2 [Phaeomoniella chlamydospora]|uniref:Putative meiosis protein mei2 n=1 Tax=Phaeomoniella chlamydospora TaxID=158046 RepID=A0A0G2HLQ7_PHACM|nr:putative meiosis protein mei2 [Phaeomoniella chlamydospora]
MPRGSLEFGSVNRQLSSSMEYDDNFATSVAENGAETSKRDRFAGIPVYVNNLSPTAASFTPSFQDSGMAIIKPPAGARFDKVKHVSKASLIDISSLVPTSVPEEDVVGFTDMSVQQDITDLTDGLARLSAPSPASASGYFSDTATENDIPEAHTNEGQFTADGNMARSLVLKRVPVEITAIDLTKKINPTIFPSFKELDTNRLATDGTVYTSFYDIEDACKAFHSLSSSDIPWIISYAKQKEYISKGDTGINTSKVSNYEGTVVIVVQLNVRDRHFPGAMEFFNKIRNLASGFGSLKAFYAPAASIPHLKKFVVEYYDTRAADMAVASLNNAQPGGFFVSASYHHPDVTEPTPPQTSVRHGNNQTAMQTPTPHDRVNPHVNALMPAHVTSGYMPTMQYNPLVMPPPSPASQTSSRYRGFSTLDRFNSRLMTRGYDLPHYDAPNTSIHNHVDIQKISEGSDVRTTIMIRNVPNDVDQCEMKAILDQTSRGQYDFMYLRIDFGNNKNVGYAFVNFADPMAIIYFVQARAGHKWSMILTGAGIKWNGRNVPSTDKTLAISYATIQGRDCLIQKFRNSSVMLEHPFCRPKLYVTGEGPDAGQEEAFPEPDNPSKMRRSVENAEHVGLFAPRAGQLYRNQQRRRQSQWDRGTSAAESEAYANGFTDPARNRMARPFNPAPPPQLPGFYHYH